MKIPNSLLKVTLKWDKPMDVLLTKGKHSHHYYKNAKKITASPHLQTFHSGMFKDRAYTIGGLGRCISLFPMKYLQMPCSFTKGSLPKNSSPWSFPPQCSILDQCKGGLPLTSGSNICSVCPGRPEYIYYKEKKNGEPRECITIETMEISV